MVLCYRVPFSLPLTPTVTSDLNLTGRRGLQKGLRENSPGVGGREGRGGGAGKSSCIFFVPKDTTSKHTIKTKQLSVPSLPLWKYKPESRTLYFCPCHGAKWVSAKILA